MSIVRPTRKRALEVIRDPAAEGPDLSQCAVMFPRAVENHPMMGPLSLSDPALWTEIHERIRAARAVHGYRRHVLSLSLPNMQRLAVAALEANAEKVEKSGGMAGSNIMANFARSTGLMIGHRFDHEGFWAEMQAKLGQRKVSKRDRDEAQGTVMVLAMAIAQDFYGTPTKPPPRGASAKWCIERDMFAFLLACESEDCEAIGFGVDSVTVREWAIREARAIVKRYGKSGRRKG